jgi:hypothetical protein
MKPAFLLSDWRLLQGRCYTTTQVQHNPHDFALIYLSAIKMATMGRFYSMASI